MIFNKTEDKRTTKSLFLIGEVTEEQIQKLQESFSEELKENDNSDITLFIDSPGGCIKSCLNMFYFLKKYVPEDRLTVNFEYSASAANIFLCLPHKKVCFKHASWFYHEVVAARKIRDSNKEIHLNDSDHRVNIFWEEQKAITTRKEVEEKSEFYLYPGDLKNKGIQIEVV